MDVAKKALDAGISAAKAGNTIGDIGAAIEAVIKPYGFGIPIELGGHGVGKTVAEDPYIANCGEKGKGEK